ncbi:MAG: maltodextrin utilization protein YvdJ [Sulfurimonas sp.]|jgi:maltodextrin utilization protein YvdJ|uniref:hypothetical protein n=1 Tax=Sulfurimonas sp. TaxID=2022749 RepID=UPI0039E361FB
MKISILSTTLFLASLLLTPLSAQGNEKLDCADAYDLCSAKCEALKKGNDRCVDKCDEKEEKCSEQEEKASK